MDYLKIGQPPLNQSIYIPSLCLYTGMNWSRSPTTPSFLLYSNESAIPTHPLITKRSSLGRFQWDTLMKFRGIIHIPYEASTMSIFEHISSKIPMFFPTKRFLKEMWTSGAANCQCDYWRVIEKGETPAYLAETRSFDFWIERADYYALEGYYYFDSIPQLFEMISDFNDPLYELRSSFVDNRKSSVYSGWSKLILNLST
jgi:hypothetical protein